MRLFKLFVGVLLSSLPAPASAAIRAVFVGIDTYAWSQTRFPKTSDFKDLHGAVNDARNIKEALRDKYTVDFDREVKGKCPSANAFSITLINQCATRDAILAAWNKQIAASQKGDTLIFYYAGHGSRYIESRTSEQATGYNDTILPYDARKPGAKEADILDREIRTVIDSATAKGINVVTIFDSCHSGTVTRDGPVDGDSRSAPPRRASGLVPVERTVASRPGDGYRVHFAAAADGEEARESGAVGTRAGVFTSAFAETIRAIPNAAFADIATEVRLKVGEGGHTAQHPQAEGALNASMGGADKRGALFDIKSAGGMVWLGGGRLTGVTEGSRFALYPSTTAALAGDTQPLAHARVTRVEATRAALEFEDGASPALEPKTVALETQHAFGEQSLLVRNGATPTDAKALAAMLREMPFVKVAEPATLAIVPAKGEYKLVGADGVAIAALGPIAAPEFTGGLRNELQKIARAQALLALRTPAASADTLFCVSNDLKFEPDACPAVEQSDGPVLKLDQKAKLSVVNKAGGPRFIYVYAIEEDYAVNLVLPFGKGIDKPVGADKAITDDTGAPSKPGRIKFLMLSTTDPIKASVLEQTGVGERDPAASAACGKSALTRALCLAQQGARDPAVPRVENWTASVVSAIVK